MYATDVNPSNQIPWFATSLGHIDLQTSRDWREDSNKKEEKLQDEENSASSVKGRKSSISSQRIGVGGLPPLVEKRKIPLVPTIAEKVITGNSSSPVPESYAKDTIPQKIDHAEDKVRYFRCKFDKKKN